MVGYHMPFTNAFEFVRKYLNNAKADVLKISADVCSGISFNNDFSNGWRSKDPLSISITGIGHILSILPLFGISELPPVFVKRGSYSGYHDTALFHPSVMVFLSMDVIAGVRL